MPRLAPVEIIHVICPDRLYVEALDRGQFASSIWVVADRAANQAKRFALHRHRSEPSYLQGRIVQWSTVSRLGQGKMPTGKRFVFEAGGPAVSWPERSGNGEKAYTR